MMNKEAYQKEVNRILANPSECKRYLELEDLFRKYEPHPDEDDPTVEDIISYVIQKKSIDIYYGYELTSIPSLVFELDQIEEFSMYEHSLEEISAEIKNLKHLKILRINNNKITSLPVEIAELKNLEELYIDNNPITKLVPRLFYNARNLKILSMDNLKIKRIPDSIYYLEKLEHLSISGCLTKDIDLTKFKNLRCVEVDGFRIYMEHLT